MAKATGWKKDYARLWKELVPRSGQAETLQGELVRIAGKLSDEAYRNGNANWDENCERMLRFVGVHLDDQETFLAKERKRINAAIEKIIEERDTPDLRGDGSSYYHLTEKVIEWCLAHPEPIPHAHDPSLGR